MKKFKFLQMLVLLAAIIMHTDTARAEALYVFFPSVMSATSLQKKLNEGWPKIELMVFGRFKDFEDRVKKDMPDAMLTKPMVIELMKGYTVRLNGLREGSIEESYILLNTGSQMDINRLSDRTIGVFDILGRTRMNNFVGKYINPVPNLRRASKMEDLLQILTFSIVDSILIPHYYADYYKKISKLDFVITPLPNMKTGILALAVRQGGNTDLIVKTLTASEKQYMELLEVDQWK